MNYIDLVIMGTPVLSDFQVNLHVPPLEIILLYCAPPAVLVVLVRWAWPTYFMRTRNATSHCEWQNRAWSIAFFGHFFILLIVSEGTPHFKMPPRGI